MNGESKKLPGRYDDEVSGGVAEKLGNLEFSGKRIMDLSVGREYAVSSSSKEGRRRFKEGRIENLNNLEGATDRREIDVGAEGGENLDEIEGLREDQRRYLERKRYSASIKSLEGPSNNYSESSYDHGKQFEDGYSGHQFDNLEYSGDNRTELLRKIDELKDQLSRSGMSDKHIEKNPHHLRNVHNHHYNGSEDSLSDRSSGKYRPFMQNPYPDHPSAPISYMNQYAESSAYTNMNVTGGSYFSWTGSIADKPIELNDHHLKNLQNGHYNASADRFSDRPTLKNRPFMQHPFPDQYPAPASFMNNYAEPLAYMSMQPTGRFNNFHPPQSIRSCVQVVGDPYQRFLDIPQNSFSYDYENSVSRELLNNGPKAINMPQVQSENRQLYARWVSEVDSEASSLASYRRRPRLKPITGSQHCRPIGGSAPFITCKNCFELLQVPKRIMVQDGMQKKMRCGTCSSMVVIDISNKNFLDSIHEEKQESIPVAGNDKKLIEGNTYAQGHRNRASLTISSEDYDHSGYEFQSMDREPIQRMTNQKFFAESAETKCIHSTDEVANQNPLAASKRSSSPIESSMKGKPPPPPAGSSLQDYFEYSNKYHRGNNFKKGSRSSDKKTLMTNITASRENCIKDASEATEMELSSNEYGNTESSLDSGVPGKNGGQLRLNNAAEAFFARNTLENNRDPQPYNLQDEHDEDNVTINGHLIPNQSIKKAENVAGPIKPGNYWYDFRAGFWGVYGGPCLGIIPPCIEEFKYTMPENCAGGNTSVYVNGRELHQKDLNLLVSRGLPNEKNRYYNIKISGKVIDEMTGEVLDSLGKLAPTVSRVKHGYGMKAPKQQHEL